MKSIILDIYKPKSLMNYILQPGEQILTQQTPRRPIRVPSRVPVSGVREQQEGQHIPGSCEFLQGTDVNEKGEKDSSHLKSKTSKNQLDFKGKVKIIMTLSSLSPTQ